MTPVEVRVKVAPRGPWMNVALSAMTAGGLWSFGLGLWQLANGRSAWWSLGLAGWYYACVILTYTADRRARFSLAIQLTALAVIEAEVERQRAAGTAAQLCPGCGETSLITGPFAGSDQTIPHRQACIECGVIIP